jgi:hypothetical protein
MHINYDELIGKTFNDLTLIKEVSPPNNVLKPRSKYFLFKCSCGKDFIASGYNVYYNHVKKCTNCRNNDNKTEMVGKVFGELTCIKEVNKNELKIKSTNAFYLFRCSCGNEFIKRGSDVRQGKCNRCISCFKKRNTAIRGEKNSKFTGYKEISGAYWFKVGYKRKHKKIITIEYAWDLFLKQNRKCALTGLELYFPKTTNGDFTASLDRIDSTKDYIEGNVQWVHKDINMMKNKHSQNYFINLCKLVADNFK